MSEVEKPVPIISQRLVQRPAPLVELLQQPRLPTWEEELWSNKRRVIYGPVASRRLGESLGINLFPIAKICSFNCNYCDVGLTPPRAMEEEFRRGRIPPFQDLAMEIEEGIRRHLEAGRKIDHVTLCGNGEATDHPAFVQVVQFLLGLKPRLSPGIPLAILTNSAHVDKAEVVDAINAFDINFCKLDAGDQATFETVSRPLPGVLGFDQILEGLKRIRDLRIQTAVVDSPTVSNLASLRGPYVEILQELRPQAAYLHNIDYPVPDRSIRRLSQEEMLALGEEIAERSGVPIKVLTSPVSLRRRPARSARDG